MSTWADEHVPVNDDEYDSVNGGWMVLMSPTYQRSLQLRLSKVTS